MHANHPYRCNGAEGIPAEGHIPPQLDEGENVVNCTRCGRRLYWDGAEEKFLPKPDEVKTVAPKGETVGYFNWRRNLRGLAIPEKVLKVHVDTWLAMHKHHYHQVYKATLIHSVELNEAQWLLSLAKLSESYPCPKFDPLQGLKDATK